MGSNNAINHLKCPVFNYKSQEQDSTFFVQYRLSELYGLAYFCLFLNVYSVFPILHAAVEYAPELNPIVYSQPLHSAVAQPIY